MYSRNSAYDFAAFEERKVKKQRKVIKFPHQKQKKRVQLRAKMALGVSFLSIFLSSASICTFFIYGQVVLSELTEQTNQISTKLTESESIHTQLKMKKEAMNSLNSTQKAQEDISRYTLNGDCLQERYIPYKDVAIIR